MQINTTAHSLSRNNQARGKCVRSRVGSVYTHVWARQLSSYETRAGSATTTYFLSCCALNCLWCVSSQPYSTATHSVYVRVRIQAHATVTHRETATRPLLTFCTARSVSQTTSCDVLELVWRISLCGRDSACCTVGVVVLLLL